MKNKRILGISLVPFLLTLTALSSNSKGLPEFFPNIFNHKVEGEVDYVINLNNPEENGGKLTISDIPVFEKRIILVKATDSSPFSINVPEHEFIKDCKTSNKSTYIINGEKSTKIAKTIIILPTNEQKAIIPIKWTCSDKKYLVEIKPQKGSMKKAITSIGFENLIQVGTDYSFLLEKFGTPKSESVFPSNQIKVSYYYFNEYSLRYEVLSINDKVSEIRRYLN